MKPGNLIRLRKATPIWDAAQHKGNPSNSRFAHSSTTISSFDEAEKLAAIDGLFNELKEIVRIRRRT